MKILLACCDQDKLCSLPDNRSESSLTTSCEAQLGYARLRSFQKHECMLDDGISSTPSAASNSSALPDRIGGFHIVLHYSGFIVKEPQDLEDGTNSAILAALEESNIVYISHSYQRFPDTCHATSSDFTATWILEGARLSANYCAAMGVLAIDMLACDSQATTASAAATAVHRAVLQRLSCDFVGCKTFGFAQQDREKASGQSSPKMWRILRYSERLGCRCRHHCVEHKACWLRACSIVWIMLLAMAKHQAVPLNRGSFLLIPLKSS